MSKKQIPLIVEVPQEEIKEFDDLIKKYRNKYIRGSKDIVDIVFKENEEFCNSIKKGKVSTNVQALREIGWQEFLKDEVNFNALLMKDLHHVLKTPKSIIEKVFDNNLHNEAGAKNAEEIMDMCGEYAGRVFPYIYRLCLSNTQSRRSRSGTTFEAIMYRIYELLEYPYDSQNKVGRKIFSDVGLGKKVDSILPSIECFEKRRNMTIIGTMKTSLRERWQEVAEEIERTKIPEIHLLTVDEEISKSKAQEMANHNIIIVAYDWVANSESLKGMKNIISFEEYLFEEIPNKIKYWKKNER
jgi:hypothetical protein